MSEEEIIKNAKDLIFNDECWIDDEDAGVEEQEFAKMEKDTIQGLLDLYQNLKEIEEEHKKENGKLRKELKQEKENRRMAEHNYDELTKTTGKLETELEEEKEKNKELEEKLKVGKQLYNDSCICIATECVEKAKIKAKIEELEAIEGEVDYSRIKYAIIILQELLERR